MEEIINRHKAAMATKGAKESEILEVLNLLKTMPMTADLLSKTKIGVAVQQVRAASESSAAVEELARDVIKQWIAITRCCPRSRCIGWLLIQTPENLADIESSHWSRAKNPAL